MKSKEFIAKGSGLILTVALLAGMAMLRPTPGQTRSDSDLIPLLPNGEGVVTLDVQRLIGSELWTMASSQGRFKNLISQAQTELASLGVKTSDLKTAAIVVSGGALDQSVGIVTGSFSETGLLNHLREDKQITVTTDVYKGSNLYVVSQRTAAGQMGLQLAFAFHDSSTMALGSPAGVKSSIDVKAGDQQGIAQNEKYAGVLSQLPAGAVGLALSPQFFLGHFPKDMVLPLPDLKNVSLVFGSLDVSANVDLNLTFRNGTAEQGTEMATNLNALLKTAAGVLRVARKGKYAPIADALKTFSVSSKDQDVKMTGTLSKELFAQVMK